MAGDIRCPRVFSFAGPPDLHIHRDADGRADAGAGKRPCRIAFLTVEDEIDLVAAYSATETCVGWASRGGQSRATSAWTSLRTGLAEPVVEPELLAVGAPDSVRIYAAAGIMLFEGKESTAQGLIRSYASQCSPLRVEICCCARRVEGGSDQLSSPAEPACVVARQARIAERDALRRRLRSTSCRGSRQRG